MEVKNINGFFWAVLDAEEAKEVFEKEVIYILYDDDSEALIESIGELHNLDIDCQFGIEIGHLEELKSDWQEACDRNNEKRSLKAWLEDKAENLIN